LVSGAAKLALLPSVEQIAFPITALCRRS